MRSSFAAFGVSFLLAATAAHGQTPAATDRARDPNAHSWWVYAGDHQIHGPWGVYSEMQIRRSDFASIWQQFQKRDALTYRFSPRVQVATGYVFTYTDRYGDFPVARAFNEHRTYQQIAVRQEVGKLALEHRYRTEQRWIQNYTSQNNTGGNDFYWRYQNRFRYQIRGAFPISKASPAGRQWYLFFGDEMLLGYGPNHGLNTFDQNRACAGVGYRVTRNNSLELGYLNQFLIQRNNRVEEHNQAFRLQWSSSTPLAKLFR